MEPGVLCHQFVNNPSSNLFTILSKADNLLVFCTAKNGLTTHSTELHEAIPTRKRYYKALKQLKDAGLIEKSPKNKGTYFHTTFGSIVYQRQIEEVLEYAKNMQKMKMVDTLRHTNEYSDNDIQNFIRNITFLDNKSDINRYSPATFHSEVIWSFDDLLSSLTKRIRNSKTEILIAARLSPEKLINEIILKAKTGVKVKVLADTKLVKGYFESQKQQPRIQIPSKTENEPISNPIESESQEKERIKVVGNPWYPNKEGIDRRICDIPFGMIVIDEEEVGVELINRNLGQGFFAGIMLKDEKIAKDMKKYYLKLWEDTKDSYVVDTVNVNKVH
jgi:DNA-binding PadR family transcriptional regulator